MKTLKGIAKELGISLSKASRIKQSIEAEKYPGVPPFMVWGTGSQKQYSVNAFKNYLNHKNHENTRQL